MPVIRPVDETFFDTAPVRHYRSWRIARPAAAVWAELVGERPLHWCRGLDVRWTSPRPFAVGTTRRAAALGVLSVDEHFFLWEEGRRYAFHGTAMSLPVFDSVAEDYDVQPLDPGSCVFTWRIAVAPSTVGRLGTPLTGPLFGSWFRDTARYFAAG